MRRAHVIVVGAVQGVGYRYSLQHVARDAAVAGWVRNRRDGSVEAELEGASESVDAVVAWMAEGPPSARVTASELRELTPTGAVGFDIRPTEGSRA